MAAAVRLGELERKLMLIGTGRGHGETDPAHTDPHQRADFQQFQPDAAATGPGELGVGQTDAARRAEQHAGKPQAQLRSMPISGGFQSVDAKA